TCEIPGVGPVPIETAREVLGDAIMHLVITKGADIASITNLGRTIKAPLRRAVIERDQTCVVPGCDVRNGLEIDHRIIPVVENGETALWNLARLCRHHHHLRHHRGFRLEGGPGDWQWLPPEKPPPQHLDESDTGDDDRLFKLE
ncbi:MAG TPA: HNH endonuclease signature motif containing protein, partial [Acidimicrobiales bacterium]|nr:HNH endonuclease signature motif containing protein [Acidimicrobiales bacterium]